MNNLVMKLLGLFLVVVVIGSNLDQRLAVLNFDYEFRDEEYEFIWDSPHEPYLEQMLVEFHLEQLVQDADSDLEKVVLVTDWVHNLWKHDGLNEPEHSDPISILRAVQAGERFRCVEYSIVIHGALNALGIPTRKLGLKTEDVETRKVGAGHVVAEAYLRDFEKWVLIDGQWGVIPMLEGVPLNGVELQQAIAERKGQIELLGRADVNKRQYLNWIGEYLYYFDVALDNRVADPASDQKLMLVPLGAKNPTVFQIKWDIGNMLYTNSVNAFYARPSW